MNTYFTAKVETCLELCDRDAEKFKYSVMKVTDLTEKGFHELAMTDVAFQMIERGESINSTIKAVI